MADEYEPLGPADNAVAPPPDPVAPPPDDGSVEQEVYSFTGKSGTGTEGATSIVRSRAAKIGDAKAKNKPAARNSKNQKKKPEKKKNEKTASKSSSSKSNSAKQHKKSPILLCCVIGLALAFVLCLILTIIVMGHAWMGFSFITIFTVDNEEESPTTTIKP